MTSHWILISNTKDLPAATKLLNRVKGLLDTELVEDSIESHHNGGHRISFSIHCNSTDWVHFVYETIRIGQLIGRGWSLLGDIESQLDGFSTESVVSGIKQLQFICDKQLQS